ncbi:hypothetical protein FQN54_006963 [Arachnomyces sp. PD_36]|nr:hypothetical protein FQN54_006963 [Arachnomyces sp. PD_36]
MGPARLCLLLAFTYSLFLTAYAEPRTRIQRERVISSFNPHRNASSATTPFQVGNGDFAFGADVTGLQTFQPFNTLSSWGWHNDSLPTTPGQTSPSDFTGLSWWTHGRLVPYAQPNPDEEEISQWMIANPHRINLGQIGLYFGGDNVTEQDLTNVAQTLDLYTGTLGSTFEYNGSSVAVKVVADPNSDTIAVEIHSELLVDQRLGVFFDYPYASGKNKFDAPYVGVWNATDSHTTSMQRGEGQVVIQHSLDSTTYYNRIEWEDRASISGPLNGSHRHILQPGGCSTFKFTALYSPSESDLNEDTASGFDDISAASQKWWQDYWEDGAFIDFTSTQGFQKTDAIELQRRTILSQYLLAVNGAGHDPAQESGLTNNGWYGKFHAEMFHWHLAHWQRWGKWSLFDRTMPGLYQRFLPSSIERAEEQGYEGARWGKMGDPSGRSAPGEINSLLIWQQPHPFMFAETEYSAFPTEATLEKWNEILVQSADFMASFAFWNESTGVYDLGPPMYPVSENTNPNATVNPTFELAYWKFGLDVAAKWQERQRKTVPSEWTRVAANLAPLPISNGTYVVYEGIPDMWNNATYTDDHPAMLGIYGWLPPPSDLNLTIMENTRDMVYDKWNLPNSYGWDFPLLAMNAARLRDPERAIQFLLDPHFQFDDAGYPVGGARVPTPYFPSSSSMLLALAMMAGGWPGQDGPLFPDGWAVEAEGFTKAF